MTKIFQVFTYKILTISVAALLSVNLIADNHMETPTFLPLEGFACNYNRGKDASDLNKVVAEWNEYADSTGIAYNAWLFTPYYYSEDQKADTIWIGVAPTWEGMMKAAETMTTEEGQNIQQKFDRVSECYDHTGWGLEIVRSSDTQGNGLATTQWCTLNEGVTPDKVLAADKKMNDYYDKQNINGGFSRWWPGSGIPSRFDADMLWVQTASSMAEWGREVDRLVNGGGNQVMSSIYGDLMSCKNREVFSVTALRVTQNN
tara:strand:- start:217 stop:993 length:777 start_codon:yes stop_codon:yes gene_type:complete